MKSWISFLLPDDEYKEKRVLYFFAEGGILLLFTLVGLLILNNYFHLDAETALLMAIAVFLIYVTGRYTLSGIEYTDIATVGAYSKELRHIMFKTSSFAGIFILLYLVFIGVPSSQNEWIDIIGILVVFSLFWFLTNYISLKRSYKKNKELL
ncbi:DUF3278 domain-containing protein [Alkalibacillus almallahensis]|uniref:DUF3278 domain-containing protein n=1 Tax=Alkalibacillus almallahensis TaxID=1379154 RepID=UPI0014201CB8|nr:DUF3278 domain-containing protein [Alkalibacillus almallahensis]NIK12123.1 hypothetical protein [Alkalibacillus almallahensis]